MTTPSELPTVPVRLGDRDVLMRMLTDGQQAALLDFERQASLLDRMAEGEAKTERSITLAKRVLLLIGSMMVNPDDWDWAMDGMITGELKFEDLTDVPARLLNAMAGEGNRQQRRAVAKATRTKRE